MTNGFIAQLIIQLSVGGVAVFLGILLWTKTRDPAWMLIVASALSFYAGIFYRILRSTGIVSPIMVGGVLVIDVVFELLPLLFMIVAFIVIIIKIR